MEGEEDSIQLLEGNFHTHGDTEARVYGLSREKAIRKLVGDIFSGKLLLVEWFRKDGSKAKKIWDSLEYLTDGDSY